MVRSKFQNVVGLTLAPGKTAESRIFSYRLKIEAR
jgi:hypothetical protein